MPQSIPRLIRAAASIGLASVPVVALGMPAYAASVQSHEWWLRTLHVTQAWRGGRGSGITIAVLADGVDAHQPDIAGSVVQGRDFTGSGRHSGGPYFGVVGTGLASLIVGHGNGGNGAGAGFLGVAPEASILSVRVTLSPGDPLWSNSQVTARLPGAIAAGIRYAVHHRAGVIELPPDPAMPGLAGWGGVSADAGGSAAERSAIAYALSRNVMLIAPAGDNARAGDAVNYPAADQGVISVGAFNSTFMKAPFSNRRSYVTLTAAGEGVIAAARSGYQTMNSTWAASAITAGIAGLVRSQFPSLSTAQVTTALTKGTRFHPPGGRLDGSGFGTIDAWKAIDAASAMSPPHAVRASRGALPRVRPTPPRTESVKAIMMADLARDGEIAGGILAALLAAILAYHSLGRRRSPTSALAKGKRGDQRLRREPAAAAADPLLEFFGPQLAKPDERPAGQRPQASLRYQPRPTLTGRSTLSALSARPGLPGVTAASGQAAPPGPSGVTPGVTAEPDPIRSPGAAGSRSIAAILSAVDGTGAVPSQDQAAGGRPGGQDAGFRWTTSADAHRPQRPKVTGTPPWGPAPEPTTALPWAVIPGPPGDAHHAVSATPTRQAPPDSVWNDSGPTGPTARSAFDPAEPAGSGQAQFEADQPSGPDAVTGAGGQPIYVWKPSGAADPFRAVEDEPHRPV